MRLIDFLNEDKNIPWDKIKQNCSKFLNDLSSTDQFLYSGRKKKGTNFFKEEVRKDRLPTKTSLVFHNKLDDMFQKKFGIKLRSNSLFVTKFAMSMFNYGKPFIVFPIGNYKLYSNTEFNDLVPCDFWEKNKYELENDEDLQDKVVDAFKQIKLKEVSGLQKQEIMLVCDSYYALYTNEVNVKQIYDILK